MICVDIDNGPDWTVTEANRELYGAEGLRRVAALLAPGGAVTFWSASASDVFEQRLSRVFTDVDVLTVEVMRGEPDSVYRARSPAVVDRDVSVELGDPPRGAG